MANLLRYVLLIMNRRIICTHTIFNSWVSGWVELCALLWECKMKQTFVISILTDLLWLCEGIPQQRLVVSENANRSHTSITKRPPTHIQRIGTISPVTFKPVLIETLLTQKAVVYRIFATTGDSEVLPFCKFQARTHDLIWLLPLEWSANAEQRTSHFWPLKLPIFCKSPQFDPQSGPVSNQLLLASMLGGNCPPIDFLELATPLPRRVEFVYWRPGMHDCWILHQQ